MRAGPDFGNLQGKLLLVKKALYGLKYLGAAFRAFLAETLNDIGFRSSISDPDVWMRVSTKPTGEKYSKYIMCFVDDIFCIFHNDRHTMVDIQKNMKFKNDNIEEPNFYVGTSLKKE